MTIDLLDEDADIRYHLAALDPTRTLLARRR